jgi:hypothetical protein
LADTTEEETVGAAAGSGGHCRRLCFAASKRGKEELRLRREENEFIYERVRWAPSS